VSFIIIFGSLSFPVTNTQGTKVFVRTQLSICPSRPYPTGSTFEASSDRETARLHCACTVCTQSSPSVVSSISVPARSTPGDSSVMCPRSSVGGTAQMTQLQF